MNREFEIDSRNKKSITGKLFLAIIISEVIFRIVINLTVKRGIVYGTYSSVILGQAIVLVPVFGYLLITRTNPFKILPYKKIKILDILLIILASYCLLPMVTVLNLLSQLFSDNIIQGRIENVSDNAFLINYFFISVIPACFEEFSFRGIIFHDIKKINRFKGIIISAFIFGLLHLNFNQFFYAFALGIFFALLIEATGSMFSSMISHLVINGNAIIILYLSKFFISDTLDGESTASLSNYSPIMILVIAGIWLVFAMGFLIISFLIITNIAKRNNRQEKFKKIMKERKDFGEKIFNIPLLISVIVCIAYMVFTN